MGRMYGPGKGKSGSCLPFKKTLPNWCKASATEVTKSIVQLAKKGIPPSQIGGILRDSQGVPNIRQVCRKRISRILRKEGLAPEIPESLYFLMKRAVCMRKHLSEKKADISAKYRLGLCESKIHRLSRYYRRTRKLPAKWKYTPTIASAIVA